MDKPRYRNTKQRTALLRLLGSTKTHPTAAWLFERLRVDFPGMSQGTIYRNLAILAEQGLLRVIPSGKNSDRFDADTSAHYHVVCERCGRVDDLPLPVGPDREQEAERASGYRITTHRLDFFGICPECRKTWG